MIKTHAFLMVIVLWIIPVLSPDKHNEQDSVVEKRSAFFVSYMKETFPDFKLTDGEYLFILPSGCFKCTCTVHDFLLSLCTHDYKLYDRSQKDTAYLAEIQEKNHLLSV